MDKLLVIKHLEVEGANAIAGVTWGFPAITSFLGFTHALQRKVQEKVSDTLVLDGCAVICHRSQVQSYGNNMSREHYFALTRNPLVLKGKEAVTAPFNEEGKMRIEVSLLISVSRENGPIFPNQLKALEDYVAQSIPTMRLAGGAITQCESVELVNDIGAQNRDSAARKRFLRQLLPGFALVSRHDVLQAHAKQTEQTLLDAWLDFSTRKMRAAAPEHEGEKATWSTERPDFSGWLKPIMIGYQGISACYDAGDVGHVRDRTVPAQFVESIYSLGQWISPHRITDIEQLLWTQSYDPEHSFYLCNNNYQPETPTLLHHQSPVTAEEK